MWRLNVAVSNVSASPIQVIRIELGGWQTIKHPMGVTTSGASSSAFGMWTSTSLFAIGFQISRRALHSEFAPLLPPHLKTAHPVHINMHCFVYGFRNVSPWEHAPCGSAFLLPM